MDIFLVGIPSAEAFFDDDNQFGYPSLGIRQYVICQGIPGVTNFREYDDDNQFGETEVSHFVHFVYPTGIPSAEAFGTLAIANTSAPLEETLINLVSDLVAGRMYPGIAPQRVAVPRITYTINRARVQPAADLTGGSLTLNVWDTRYDDCEELSQLVLDRLLGKHGQLTCLHNQTIETIENRAGNQQPFHRRIILINFWFAY